MALAELRAVHRSDAWWCSSYAFATPVAVLVGGAMSDDWNQRVEGIDGDDCDYRRTPSFVSRADPNRLEKIFAKSRDTGRFSRWRILKMEKRIAEAKLQERGG